MKQRGLATILIILLLATVVGGYLIYQKQTKPAPVQQAVQPSPSPKDASPAPTGAGETANWETYTSKKHYFSMKYPSNITLKEESSGNVTLSLMGPTQEKEQGFHDGIYLTFLSGSKNNQDLADVVKADIDKTIKESSPYFNPIKENQTSVEIAGLKGYSYVYEQAGVHIKIFLEMQPSRYLVIDDATVDPTSHGYKKIVDQILSTFKFLDQK